VILVIDSKENERKGKEYLYSVIYNTHNLVSKSSDSFTCKLHHACLSFVISVHQMAPPITEVADIKLQLTTHLSTLKE